MYLEVQPQRQWFRFVSLYYQENKYIRTVDWYRLSLLNKVIYLIIGCSGCIIGTSAMEFNYNIAKFINKYNIHHKSIDVCNDYSIIFINKI